jgi:hypothetical protein
LLGRIARLRVRCGLFVNHQDVPKQWIDTSPSSEPGRATWNVIVEATRMTEMPAAHSSHRMSSKSKGLQGPL